MNAMEAKTGYDMYFRAHQPKAHKKAAGKRHHTAKVHTRRVHHSRIFNVPDEQMSEPPVVPKDERRYWH
jgi:hypothetical protein